MPRVLLFRLFQKIQNLTRKKIETKNKRSEKSSLKAQANIILLLNIGPIITTVYM